jgi:RNA polymerase sigma factor (sigma-70 family)
MLKMVRPESEATNWNLANALEGGDHDLAMEILVDSHGEEVYRYCRRILGSSPDVDDVSQIVFVQAFQCMSELPRIRSPGAWLLGIARHRCLDHLRSGRRDVQILDGEDLCVVADRHLDDQEVDEDPRLCKVLDECLDRLDARSRAVLILRFRDELSYDEISRLTSDTTGALRVRLARALPALRRCLEEKGITP